MSSGSHETGSTAKKVTVSDSAKPGPHIHIFFLIQWLRVSVEMGTKSEKVCVCVYFTLYLQGHILGCGLATLSFDRYKIAQTLQGRSCILCFETILGMNKIAPKNKISKKFFLFSDIFKKFV